MRAVQVAVWTFVDAGFVSAPELARQEGASSGDVALEVAWAPVALAVLPADADRDGLLDHGDACVDQPEDFDQFEDGDGCPEPTAIRVTVLDASGQPVQAALVMPDGERAFVGSLSESVWPGRYRVRATAPGAAAAAEIVVQGGGPAEFTVSLAPAE